MTPFRAKPRSQPHQTAQARDAFTLIELLVVLGLIAALSAIAVGALNATERADRIENASQQIKNMLEGARQRAAQVGKPIGVRFVLAYPEREGDLRDPKLAPAGTLRGRVCTSLAYVGAAPPYLGTCNINYSDVPPATTSGTAADPNTIQPTLRDWQASSTNPPNPNLGTATAPRPLTWVIDDATIGSAAETNRPWERLASIQYRIRPTEQLHDNSYSAALGVLTPGSRIEIPAFSNSWYTISPRYFNPGGDLLTLVEDYQPSRPIPTTFGSGSTARTIPVPNAMPSRNVPYRLDLGMTILPDYGTVELPEGVVIDLDASALPSPQNPNQTLPQVWGEDLADDSDDAIDDYPEQIDIVFAPNGALISRQASDGVLALLVTTLDDAVRARRANDGAATPFYYHPQTAAIEASAPSGRGDDIAVPAAGVSATVGGTPSVQELVQDERRVVAIYSQTGQIESYGVSNTDTDSAGTLGYGFADDPFNNANAGRIVQ